MFSVKATAGWVALAAGAMLLAGCGRPTFVDPSSESTAAARMRAHDRLDAHVAELRAAPTSLGPLSEAVLDECVEGQHNWKIDDPYDSRCGLTVVAAFTFDGEFLDRLRELDNAFRDLGWRGEGIKEALDYWHECSDGSCRNFPEYGPADLPTVSYHRADDQIAVDLAAADTPRADLEWMAGFSRDRLRDSCDSHAYHCVVRGKAWGGPWRSVRRDYGFLLILTSSEVYASTGT